jgi:hypothetical protein
VSGISLKANGLRLLEGLACPSGGPHDVPGADVVAAKARGGGHTRCVKCGGLLTLVTTD